jgi:hypothetical protein
VLKPGPEQPKYPNNIFNTWLAYKEDQGIKQSELIRAVNVIVNRKYDNGTFYKWKTQKGAVPDLIIALIITPELDKVLKWYFTKQDYDFQNIDFKKLASAFKPPIKTNNS